MATYSSKVAVFKTFFIFSIDTGFGRVFGVFICSSPIILKLYPLSSKYLKKDLKVDTFFAIVFLLA